MLGGFPYYSVRIGEVPDIGVTVDAAALLHSLATSLKDGDMIDSMDRSSHMGDFALLLPRNRPRGATCLASFLSTRYRQELPYPRNSHRLDTNHLAINCEETEALT